MLDSWEWMGWYESLNKPGWTPTGETIGVIWSILYPLIIISYGWVLYKIYKREIPKKYLWGFLVNIVTNILFTPIFFGLKNIPLATVDILIVWITIVINLKVIQKYSQFLVIIQIPYFCWVTLASFLQLSILFLNW